jgi:phenylpropionate dioxygenase-like ring-hydroxylating dioxygenase large terminal subunit
MRGPDAILRPPATKPHYSVVRLPDHWYIACRSEELGRRKPLARTVLGIPMALFRDGSGKAGALVDRCPHRNVPLTFGRIEKGELECGYHGWRFDTAGACRAVPGLCGSDAAASPNGAGTRDEPANGAASNGHRPTARDAVAHPVVEQDGFVWVFGQPGEMPQTRPMRFELAGDPAYTTVRGHLVVEGTLHATLENILDVPHTAFLHRGLFRGNAPRNEITAVVRRGPDRVEAEFLGEPRPPGIAARLLSPTGGEVTHFDRFVLPSVAQVEYRLGEENHLLISQALTPEHDFQTRIHAAISFRLRLPGILIRPFLTPLAWYILRQDAVVLRALTGNVKRFGGERYVSTEIDLLGPHIWRLLKQAERGETQKAGEVAETRVRMTV